MINLPCMITELSVSRGISKLQNVIKGKVSKVAVVLSADKRLHLSLDFVQHQVQVHLFAEESVELCLGIKDLLLSANEEGWCLCIQILSLIR